MNKPDFTQLTTEESVTLFQEIKKDFILCLTNQGFSQREIERRLGGLSYRFVRDTQIKEEKKKDENNQGS